MSYPPYWTEFCNAGALYDFDPAFLAAICERESGYGKYLDANLLGDNGHGHGLMQVDDRSFPDFCASAAYKDPAQNIMMGAKILSDKRTELLQAVASAYNCGSARGLHIFDALTTGQNYGSDVMARYTRIQQEVKAC